MGTYVFDSGPVQQAREGRRQRPKPPRLTWLLLVLARDMIGAALRDCGGSRGAIFVRRSFFALASSRCQPLLPITDKAALLGVEAWRWAVLRGPFLFLGSLRLLFSPIPRIMPASREQRKGGKQA
jgi:hypothetical protein